MRPSVILYFFHTLIAYLGKSIFVGVRASVHSNTCKMSLIFSVGFAISHSHTQVGVAVTYCTT